MTCYSHLLTFISVRLGVELTRLSREFNYRHLNLNTKKGCFISKQARVFQLSVSLWRSLCGIDDGTVKLLTGLILIVTRIRV